MTLADRVAIVTGAGNGIGRATALALGRAGADVAAVDINAAAAAETAKAVAELGRRSLALDADVGDLGAIDRMTRRVMEDFGAHRRPREQCRRHPPRLHHGSHRGGLGPHHARQR